MKTYPNHFLLPTPELIEGNGYEGRQTSKGELFFKVPLY